MCSSVPCADEASHEQEEMDRVFIAKDPITESSSCSNESESTSERVIHDFKHSKPRSTPNKTPAIDFSLMIPTQNDIIPAGAETMIANQTNPVQENARTKTKTSQSSNSNSKKGPGQVNG